MKGTDELVGKGCEKGATGAWMMGMVDEMGEHCAGGDSLRVGGWAAEREWVARLGWVITTGEMVGMERDIPGERADTPTLGTPGAPPGDTWGAAETPVGEEASFHLLTPEAPLEGELPTCAWVGQRY